MTQPDAIEWINAMLRDPETREPFVLLPAEIAFLEHAFELNDDGSAKYPELVYSCCKKSGKTGFAAILILTVTLLYGGFDPEAICAANDLEQASSRVFSAIRKIILASPALCDRAVITQTKITFPEIGATISAITSDAAGAAGANPVISGGDELWGFTSEARRRLWDELVPPPTRKAAWRLTTTYAGFSGESILLEELYKRGISQPLIGADLYAGDGMLMFWTHQPVAPWQTPAWLAHMRRSLRPNQYLRMIENRWTSSESAFIEMHLWDACVDTGLMPLQSDRNMQVFVAVDASLKRDSTGIAAVATDGERVRLVRHKVFQPSPENPLDFESTIEAEIIDLCNSFRVEAVRFDPWQMASVAQRLIKRGVPMEEFPQTSGNLTDASSNLYDLIKGGSLAVYPDEGMRLSVSQAIAVETPRGWRIAKEKQKHKIDVVVALGMACLAAVKQEPVPHAGLLEHMRRQSEALQLGNGTPMTIPADIMAEHRHQPVAHIGTKPKRPADWVKVVIPGDASQVCGFFGSYVTAIEDGRRVAWIDPRDAKVIVCSPAPSNLEVRAANLPLQAQLAADRTIKAEAPGVRVTDMLQAAYDQKEARPMTLAEEVASYHARSATAVNETLRMLGRRP